MLQRPSRRERAYRWRRYRARVRDGQMVPDMPDIGSEEISFLIETQMARGGRGQRSTRGRIRPRACGYSKLTRKSRIRRLSSQLNLSSGPFRVRNTRPR